VAGRYSGVLRSSWQRDRFTRGALLLAALTAILGTLGPASASALSLPPGFQPSELPVPRAGEGGADHLTGLQAPTAIDFGPDGTIYVAEQNGRVKSLDSPSDTTPQLVADLTRDVMGWRDLGLLNLKLDPEFPTRPFVYLAYTHDAPIGGQAPTGTDSADGADGCLGEPGLGECQASGRIAQIALDPGSGLAVGGPLNPDQNVLVEDWCQQFDTHSIGDLEFDFEGALLAGGGDGASWEVADNGQFANACGDPPLAGGSLRSQDSRTPADPTGYSGTIIRIDPDSGEAMPDNPLIAGSDVRARRIVAYGLRNPYRFELRPGTGELYVGDVGWYNWEELNRVSLPPAASAGVPNFGWPCYEGPNPSFEWNQLAGNEEAPLCKSLYEAGPTATIAPWFQYLHSTVTGLYPGDGCPTQTGASVSGLAFYEGGAAPAESRFPPSYEGALFIADASRGCLWTMRPGPTGAPDPATITSFGVFEAGDPPFTPVDVTLGPEGALYLPNFFDNSIVRIRYFANGQPPVAKLSGSPLYGSTAGGPLHVDLDASASTDPEGGGLHYSWDLDGDSTFGEGPDAPTAGADYADSENVNVGVQVTDSSGNVDVAHLTLFPGDVGPPQVQVTVDEDEWSVGDRIPFSATADDPDFEVVSMDWDVKILHCPAACHSHPFTAFSGVSGGEIVTLPHEYPSHLVLTLTARDQRGLTTQVSKELFPEPVEVELVSDPPGLPLGFNARTEAAPFTATMISGGNARVFAPATGELAGADYEFSGWSDEGERSHSISPTEALTLTASYDRLPDPDPEPDPLPREEQPPPPIQTGPPAPTTLRFCSRPSGISLRVGSERRKAPFSLELGAGAGVWVTAPNSAVARGKQLRFRRWSNGGPRRQLVTVPATAPLCAVYGAKRPRKGR